MQLLNCELLRDCAPGGKDAYQLRLPKGSCEQFIAEYSKLPEQKITASFSAPSPARTYTVRRGDTLSKIAVRYRVSLSSLMKANRIRSAKSLKVGQKLTIPGTGGAEVANSDAGSSKNSTVKKTASAKPAGVTGGTVKYTVRKEDTLWSLANRNNTTVDALVAINNLVAASDIVAGQTLLIPKTGEAVEVEKTEPKSEDSGASVESVTYVVRKNDSLYDIATRYGVSYKDIMVWNRIKDHRK
ncbi:MAG: LysM peptidoglycan-binding domain-containing protein, partial [Candidatus Latescibacterota bacterium]